MKLTTMPRENRRSRRQYRLRQSRPSWMRRGRVLALMERWPKWGTRRTWEEIGGEWR